VEQGRWNSVVSVPAWARISKLAAAGLLLLAQLVGDIDRLLQQWRVAGKCWGATFSDYVVA